MNQPPLFLVLSILSCAFSSAWRISVPIPNSATFSRYQEVTRTFARRRPQYKYQDDYYEDDFLQDDFDYETNSYEEEDEDDILDLPSRPQWESCDSANAKVLFPPSPSPTAILHFIGGTFFGALPQFTYGRFLEELSKRGNYIVVSTPPLGSWEELSTPLNHYRIAYESVRNFRIAYRTVIEDEYTPAIAQSLPIIGVGHSLGSRIHVVANTQSKLRRIGFKREGNILLSFNNYYATRAIPFLYEVGMVSWNVVRGLMDSEWVKGSTTNEEQRRRTDSSKRRRRYDDEEDYYDDDDDYSNFARRTSVRDQAIQGVEWITSQLTSQLNKMSSSLEFQPSPDELIKFVKNGKYGVSKTLLVQFDRDEIDQSSLLARALLKQVETLREDETDDGEKASGDINGVQRDGEPKLDIKFARLKGTHLTPIIRDPTSFGRAENDSKRVEDDEEDSAYEYGVDRELDDLISTVSSYIDRLVLPAAKAT